MKTALLVAVLIAPGAAFAMQAPPASAGMPMAAFVARQDSRIMAADSDGDGRISRAEFEANMKGGGGDPARRFDRIDANHDGYLDKAEIDAMAARHFRRLDSNGDGMLSPAERMAARAARRPPAPAGE